jgi:predicted kinase
MRVLILSGIPGSGKTTYANNLKGHVVKCSADDFFHRDGDYRFNPSQLGRAHGECLRKFAENLAKPESVKPDFLVVDNTNTTTLELAPYVSLAMAYGKFPELVTFLVNYKVGANRNKHNVSEDACRIMENRLLARELPKHWTVEQTVVDNNPK